MIAAISGFNSELLSLSFRKGGQEGIDRSCLTVCRQLLFTKCQPVGDIDALLARTSVRVDLMSAR